MSYLRDSYEGNAYAISRRGRGASWAPGFVEVWAWTGLGELAGDLVAAVRDVGRREQGRECVLVGHGSGGGLVQYVLAQGDVLGSRDGVGDCHSKLWVMGGALELD
jgi:alpha-beta hydrolase superfamily lysophospholipase